MLFTRISLELHPNFTPVTPKFNPRNSPKNQKRRITELEARNAFISNRLETYDSQIAGEQTRVQEIIDMVSVETTLNC